MEFLTWWYKILLILSKKWLTFSSKFKVYRRLYSRDPLSLNRAISLVDITSFRLEKLKARDLMYNSATTDECVERRKMLQQQQQENGRWFSRVFAWSRVLCGHLHIVQKSLIIIQKTLSHWRIINELHHSAPLLRPNVSSPFFEVWQFVTSLFSALIGCSCNFQPMRGRFITNHVPYKLR